MHDTPLTSIGDEALEARIVAWVLGEASGFEAAELERLCEERPELLVFRRRMCALHELLMEAEKSDADAAWKLAPEKRKGLDGLLGAAAPVTESPEKEARIRRSGRRAFFAIAACAVATLIIGGLYSVKLGWRSPPLSLAEPSPSPDDTIDEKGDAYALGDEVANEPAPHRFDAFHASGGANFSESNRPASPAAAPRPALQQLQRIRGTLADLPASPAAAPQPALQPAPRQRMLADVAGNHSKPAVSTAPAPIISNQTTPTPPKPAEALTATGTGSGGAARAGAAPSSGLRGKDKSVLGNDRDGPRKQEGSMAGEKKSLAKSKQAPADAPVPGQLFAAQAADMDEDAKSDTSSKSEISANSHRSHPSHESHLPQSLMEKTDAPLAKREEPRPAILLEECTAAQEPYSTFSLNISDASFQIAQAALTKGERPDPAGIKTEQFYNALDYGDPSPTAGEPVAVTIEQSAHPLIPGRNLVRVALKTAAAGRAASQALRLTLLVDQSGSMVRDDRRAAMDKALNGLASLLTPDDKVTVIGFARTPRLLADGWTDGQADKLTELINQSANEGGTNLEEAIKLGEQMAERHQVAGAQNRIVLFTDGAANLGDANPAHLAAKIKALRQKHLAFDIAGIAADDLNDSLLGELARNGNGRYYVVGKGGDDNFAKQLAGAFRPAAENVKVQVHFNPDRVGRYQLIGFEKDRLTTEDFRNDAVDAAELAAEEAGVAIYQVEPLADGSGELGDVSVRFRDTASGQMVERTWTIPHDPSTPALDRARPSMQLAVLAMFAAEKLRGGPLAEGIDFKQLAAPRAKVKQFYGNASRAAEVLRMIDSL